MAVFQYQIGGAAENCTPVRMVTGYSSTSIVCLKLLRLKYLKNKHKWFYCRVEKCSWFTPLRIKQVSDMYITPRVVMSPADM